MEEQKKEKELTIEDYKAAYNKLMLECQGLYTKMQEMSNAFRRLDYLIAVIKLKESFSKEFIDSCVKEVEDMMTVPAEEVKSETKEK